MLTGARVCDSGTVAAAPAAAAMSAAETIKRPAPPATLMLISSMFPHPYGCLPGAVATLGYISPIGLLFSAAGCGQEIAV